MTRNAIRDLLAAEPFRPFRVTMNSGKSYTVANPDLAVPMKWELFIALADGEHFALCGYRNIAAVETVSNGAPPRARRRRG